MCFSFFFFGLSGFREFSGLGQRLLSAGYSQCVVCAEKHHTRTLCCCMNCMNSMLYTCEPWPSINNRCGSPSLGNCAINISPQAKNKSSFIHPFSDRQRVTAISCGSSSSHSGFIRLPFMITGLDIASHGIEGCHNSSCFALLTGSGLITSLADFSNNFLRNKIIVHATFIHMPIMIGHISNSQLINDSF